MEININRFKSLPLSELISIKHGYAFEGKYFSDDDNCKYILLTPGNFNIGGGFKDDKYKYYLGKPENDFILNSGDLIVTMTDLSKNGDTLGYPALLPYIAEYKFLHNQRLGKIDLIKNDLINKRYLYYIMCSKDYRDSILASCTGSTVKHTSPSRILSYMINLPSLSTQKKIAGVLAAFDELIEVNRRKIKILEEMAQALYKEWFVKMKFPGHEKYAPPIGKGDGSAPYRVFDSPLGPIPESWEVKHLGDFGTVVTGKTPSKSEINYYGYFMPFIKIPDMHEFPFCIKTNDNLSEKGVDSQKNKILPPDSLCVSCIGTAGLVTITTNQSMTNQQINSIIINDVNIREYLYYALRNLKDLIELYGMNGATMTNLNKSKFEGLEVICPKEEMLYSYNCIIKPVFDLIKSVEYSIDYLSSLRDLLLPKLISGKIDVSELDIDQFALGDS